jgi:hypothetical protein
MKRRMDSVLLGGAMLLSGLAQHRKNDELDRKVEGIADDVEAIASKPAPQPSPVPGMPLPTGYGLQVRGPAGESILVPVCLPPGFELDSMMLCPEFLPAEARPKATAAPAPSLESTSLESTSPADGPADPAERRETADAAVERIAGTLQYVFGGDTEYHTRLEHADDVAAGERPAVAELVSVPRRRAVETHRL